MKYLMSLLLVAMLGIGGITLVGCNGEEDPVDATKDAIQDGADAVKEGAEDAGDYIKDGAEDIKDEVEDAIDY